VHVAPDGLSIKVEQIRFLKSEFSKSGVVFINFLGCSV